MFFDVYCELCKEKGVSPTRAALETGISRSTVSQWKNRGSSPKAEQLPKLAAYFGVSVDYLLGNEETEKPAAKDGSGLYGLIRDEYLHDEFVCFYEDVKDHLTSIDIADIKTLMKLRAELNRSKEE